VAILVDLAVSVASGYDIGALEEIFSKVRVGVYATVDHGDNHSSALGDSLSGGHLQETQVPFVVSDAVGSSWARGK
jgi:hypothetical protein